MEIVDASCATIVPAAASPTTMTFTSIVTFSPFLMDEEVGVLDVVADGVHDDRLGQCNLLRALDVEGEDGVGAVCTEDGGEVASRHIEVAGIFTVAVQNRGDLAVTTCAASLRPLPNSVRTTADEVVFFRHDETASYNSRGSCSVY